jgi:sulfate permease, SulP family
MGPVRRSLRSIAPDRRTPKDDALAGLPGAIGSVPDRMAASVLATTRRPGPTAQREAPS